MIAVRYVKQRPINHFDIAASEGKKLKIVEKQLYSKAEYWKYEQEHRLVLGLEVLDPVTELYFHDFNGYLNLEEIIIGERCKVSTDRVFEILNTASIKAAVYKAKCSESHFIMERDQMVDNP